MKVGKKEGRNKVGSEGRKEGVEVWKAGRTDLWAGVSKRSHAQGQRLQKEPTRWPRRKGEASSHT